MSCKDNVFTISSTLKTYFLNRQKCCIWYLKWDNPRSRKQHGDATIYMFFYVLEMEMRGLSRVRRTRLGLKPILFPVGNFLPPNSPYLTIYCRIRSDFVRRITILIETLEFEFSMLQLRSFWNDLSVKYDYSRKEKMKHFHYSVIYKAQADHVNQKWNPLLWFPFTETIAKFSFCLRYLILSF